MDSTPAISELKLSFIRAQVRILSESLEPPEDWRDYAAQSEDDLSDKAVEDALHKRTLTQFSLLLFTNPLYLLHAIYKPPGLGS